MKNTARQDWFDDLINDFVPTCPQLSPQKRGQNEVDETPMDKGFTNYIPNVPVVPTQKGNTEKILSITRKQETTIKTWLTEAGKPEEDHYLVLNKCKRDPEALAYYLRLAEESNRKKRRTKVLTILAENPNTQRAFIADTNAEPDNVILTIAIRDQYSFELTIPKVKYDPFMLLELINKGAIQ